MNQRMRGREAFAATLTLVAVLALLVPATASADHTLTVQTSPPDGGTMTPGVGTHTYEDGEVVTITATANPGYRFDHWEGDINGAPPTVEAGNNQTITWPTNMVNLDGTVTDDVDEAERPRHGHLRRYERRGHHGDVRRDGNLRAPTHGGRWRPHRL